MTHRRSCQTGMIHEHKLHHSSMRPLSRVSTRVNTRVPIDGASLAKPVPTPRRYEMHHGVKITDEALVDAAVESDRYIADRFLPDKVLRCMHRCNGNAPLMITAALRASSLARAKLCSSVSTSNPSGNGNCFSFSL